MDRPKSPRRRPEAPSEPTSLHEITRRYVATATALAKAMGLPMTEDFIRQHRESITTCFIEAGRAGVRLPAAVQLPSGGVDAPVSSTNGQGDPLAPHHEGQPTADHQARDHHQPSGHDDQVPNGEAPLPTHIPSGDNWPCSGYLITDLKPAQLHLVLARAGFRAHGDTAIVPLLAALQAERGKRMERGKRRNGEGS